MKGKFEYIDSDYKLRKCDDSNDIPADAKELILFLVENRPEPHSEEDHEHDKGIIIEFNRVKEMIYGEK